MCAGGKGLLSTPPCPDGWSAHVLCPRQSPVPKLLALDYLVMEQNFKLVLTLILLV